MRQRSPLSKSAFTLADGKAVTPLFALVTSSCTILNVMILLVTLHCTGVVLGLESNNSKPVYDAQVFRLPLRYLVISTTNRAVTDWLCKGLPCLLIVGELML